MKAPALGTSAGFIEVRFPVSGLVLACQVACLVGFGLLVLGSLGLRWQRGCW